MSGIRSLFWRELIYVKTDAVERERLWHGYLGWKLPCHVKAATVPPAGDWPPLDGSEKEALDALAESCGGHPEYHSDGATYMDLSRLVFDRQIDCKGMLFVQADFSGTSFESTVDFSGSAFKGKADFRGARFLSAVNFSQTLFHEEADFARRGFSSPWVSVKHCFTKRPISALLILWGNADLDRVVFKRMATFESAFFDAVTTFSGSSFHEGVTFQGATFQIADFNRTQFSGPSEFHATSFGRRPVFAVAHLLMVQHSVKRVSRRNGFRRRTI